MAYVNDRVNGNGYGGGSPADLSLVGEVMRRLDAQDQLVAETLDALNERVDKLATHVDERDNTLETISELMFQLGEAIRALRSPNRSTERRT